MNLKNMPEESTEKKRKRSRTPEAEMTFWEHLEELRWHLLRSAAAVLVIAIVAFINRHFVFDTIILAPKDSQFITYRILCDLADLTGLRTLCLDISSLEIININLSGQFMVHIYISIMTSLVVVFPYLLW
jgi:sec-independent protein translocase protein TatC